MTDEIPTDMEMLMILLSRVKQPFDLNVQYYRFVRTVPSETVPPFSLSGIPGTFTNVTFTCGVASLEFVFDETENIARIDMQKAQ